MEEVLAGAANTMAGIDIESYSESENGYKNENTDKKCVTYHGSNVVIEDPRMENIVRKYYPKTKSLLEQLEEECPEAEIEYSYDYPYAGDDDSKYEEALAAARKADVVILTLGGKYGWGKACTTGEGIDSAGINLPECQERFIKKLAELRKPSIGIHFDGRPISSDAADRYLNAIIEAWSPVEYGAKAIVSVIFGDYNPGGKLPVSVAYNTGQIPVFYNHENGAGYDVGTLTAFDSYVDLPHTPRYYFGYGLSYTTFEYTNLRVNKTEFAPTDMLEISADIKNTGDMIGNEVVQLYICDKCSSIVRPVKELAGFKRIQLEPGEKKTVTFMIKISQFSFLDSEMNWKVEAGDMDIMVGASSEDIRLQGSFKICSDLNIDGKSRGFFAEAEVR